MSDLVIRGATIVDPESGEVERTIPVRGERIPAVRAPGEPPPAGVRVLDGGGLH